MKMLIDRAELRSTTPEIETTTKALRRNVQTKHFTTELNETQTCSKKYIHELLKMLQCNCARPHPTGCLRSGPIFRHQNSARAG